MLKGVGDQFTGHQLGELFRGSGVATRGRRFGEQARDGRRARMQGQVAVTVQVRAQILLLALRGSTGLSPLASG